MKTHISLISRFGKPKTFIDHLKKQAVNMIPG
jgi:hypothetical protein